MKWSWKEVDMESPDNGKGTLVSIYLFMGIWILGLWGAVFLLTN